MAVTLKSKNFHEGTYVLKFDERYQYGSTLIYGKNLVLTVINSHEAWGTYHCTIIHDENHIICGPRKYEYVKCIEGDVCYFVEDFPSAYK